MKNKLLGYRLWGTIEKVYSLHKTRVVLPMPWWFLSQSVLINRLFLFRKKSRFANTLWDMTLCIPAVYIAAEQQAHDVQLPSAVSSARLR